MFDPSSTRYRPGPHESEWLADALSPWFEDGTLTDVLFRIRGGKEATVYCCRSGPSIDADLVAAKIYRPRKHRELSNDAAYRAGRRVLDGAGHGVKPRDRRLARAIRRGTRVGKRASHTSWVMHEMEALQRLHEAGADVPTPLAANHNSVLMDFVGDEEGAAPTLNAVRLEGAVAERCFEQALRNIRILLQCGLVHGDLSPYNLMVWDASLVMIDLPQACDVFYNPNGVRFFLRDVERVCTARSLGVPAPDHRVVADELWDEVFGTEEGVPLELGYQG